MVLLFVDSFDHYVTALAPLKWTSAAGVSIGAFGRHGTNGARLGNEVALLNRGIAGLPGTAIVGVHIKPAGLGLAADQGFLAFYLDATSQIDVRINPTTGVLFVTRGGTNIGTTTYTASIGVGFYTELKVVFATTAVGSVVVKVNGTTVLTLTSVITAATSAWTNQATIRGLRNGGADFDDFYLCDATGSAPTNDFLGDVRVQALLPNGNGNSSVLVGSDANSIDNYLLVDEAAPDTADYVESATIGDKDTYAFGNLTPTAGPVFGVQVLPYAAKTDAGARSIVSVARLAATEVDSAAKTLSTTYTYLSDIREAKPGGGVWTIADVNAAEFGVKIA